MYFLENNEKMLPVLLLCSPKFPNDCHYSVSDIISFWPTAFSAVVVVCWSVCSAGSSGA
jgi:hypothetical protein